MGVRPPNRAVSSRPHANGSIQLRRWNTDQHHTASDLLRLWSEDKPDPAPRRRARQQAGLKAAAPAASEAPSEPTSRSNTNEFVLLLTIEDAGKALGVGRSTVYELIGHGDLEVVHIGRSARVPVDSVQGFVRRLRAG